MLRLSQTTGYAIKALACLAEGDCRQTADIAHAAGVPRTYLPKIIQSLVRAGLVLARRGIGGGVTLAAPPSEISLLQVVEAVEGPHWLGDCLLGLDECTNTATCPTHDFWQRICAEITHELRRTSLNSIIHFQARYHRGQAKQALAVQATAPKTKAKAGPNPRPKRGRVSA